MDVLRSFAPDVVLRADTRTVLVASVIKKMLRLGTKVVSWLLFYLGSTLAHKVSAVSRRAFRH